MSLDPVFDFPEKNRRGERPLSEQGISGKDSGGMSDQILEQAADWLFRLHDAPNDPGLRRALDAWIAADPRHAEAWRAAER